MTRALRDFQAEAAVKVRDGWSAGAHRQAVVHATVERRPWPGDPRYLAGTDGTIVGPSGHPLKPMPDKDGYLRVHVRVDGRWTPRAIHLIVCETFHGPRPEGHEAAHANGVNTDNRAVNLAWKTHVENEFDKVDHGTRANGERNGSRKLSDEAVLAIRASRESRAVLAARYDVHVVTISYVRHRHGWKHLP